MFHIKSVNNKKNLTEERKIMRNCASEILIPTFINPPQNEAYLSLIGVNDARDAVLFLLTYLLMSAANLLDLF